MKKHELKIPFREERRGGKDADTKMLAVGERSITLEELPEDHPSGMRYEVRICHCAGARDERERMRMELEHGADEVNRFLDEESATKWFEVYARALGHKGPALAPPTHPGRVITPPEG